jgi:flagellar biosynthesis/type III secretory pathway chaperone
MKMSLDFDQTLLDLLTEEREAILKGAFDKLPGLAGRKEALFGDLAAAAVSGPTLRRIGAQVGRNQRLLAAALRGFREVSDRLGIVREVRDSFSTYDSAGQKSHVSPTRPAFERKS